MKDIKKNSVYRKAPLTVAIVASRYHADITSKLVAGACSTLGQVGAAYDLFWIPGAYELPQATQTAAISKKYDAVIAIGCIIRGETAHFDYIAKAVALGLDAVGRTTGVAVSFGVLTVDHLEQALARSGGQVGNKGEEAAFAAIELALAQKEILKNGKSKKSTRTSPSNSLSH